MKPGVQWLDMHKLAERTILEGLKELGIVSGDVEEMVEGRVGFLFMPHGLGHFIGLDTHDCGGYLPDTPDRNPLPGLRNVRTARVLEENMVITVEPGIYFIDFLMKNEPKLEIDNKYLNFEVIQEYMKEIRGVRIEDGVHVTATGSVNLTVVPRTVAQIEACMRGEDWEKL